jgi:hypothetical protein
MEGECPPFFVCSWNGKRLCRIAFCGGPIGPQLTDPIPRLRDRHRYSKYKKIRSSLKKLKRLKRIAVAILRVATFLIIYLA